MLSKEPGEEYKISGPSASTTTNLRYLPMNRHLPLHVTKCTVVFLLVWCITISPAVAWNATGHRIIASIAYRQLTLLQQSKVAAMIERHPRFTTDFADTMPDDVRTGDPAARQEWSFQQAAVWPDMVRSGPPEKRAFNRSEWHYVNQPHFLTAAAKTELDGKLTVNLGMEPPADATLDTQPLNIVQALRFSRKSLADQQTSPSDRAVLLAWLFHTVGDIHQPLHSTAVFSIKLFPAGDRGGNSVKTRQAGNLHSLWDQFPGAADDFREAHNKAVSEMANQELAELGTEASLTLNEKAWLDESHDLAKSHVYTDDVLQALRLMESTSDGVQPIELSEAYLKSGGRVAQRRVVQAGYRLGAVLKLLVPE